MALTDEEDPLDSIAPFRGGSPAPLDTTISPAQPMARPEKHLVRGTDPLKYRGALREWFKGDVQAAESAKRGQDIFDKALVRRQEQEQARQQAEAEHKKAADAKQAKKDVSSAREADFRSRGVQFFTDANGEIQPVKDEHGGTLYHAKKGETEYDEKTGDAFRQDRTEKGTKTRIDLDAEAKIGTHPTRMGDLYRQDAESAWNYLGSVDEGLKSADPAIKAAAQKARDAAHKHLHGAAKAGFSAIANQVSADERQANIEYGAQAKAAQAIDEQIESVKANPNFSRSTGGWLGTQIGSSPTPEAKALKDQLEGLQKQKAAIALNPPDPKTFKEQRRVAKVSAEAFDAMVAEKGSIELAAEERRKEIEASGGDPTKDPVLSSIAKVREEAGLTSPKDIAQQQKEDELRKHPLYGPLMTERDALGKESERVAGELRMQVSDHDARLAPLKAQIDEGKAQLDEGKAQLDEVQRQAQVYRDQLDKALPPGPDLSTRLSSLAPADFGKVQPILQALGPIETEANRLHLSISPLVEQYNAGVGQRDIALQERAGVLDAQFKAKADALGQKWKEAQMEERATKLPEAADLAARLARAIPKMKDGEEKKKAEAQLAEIQSSFAGDDFTAAVGKADALYETGKQVAALDVGSLKAEKDYAKAIKNLGVGLAGAPGGGAPFHPKDGDSLNEIIRKERDTLLAKNAASRSSLLADLPADEQQKAERVARNVRVENALAVAEKTLTAGDKLKDLAENPEQLAPFVRSLPEIEAVAEVAMAAARVQEAQKAGHEPEVDDQELLALYVGKANQKSTFWYKFWDVLSQQPAFMVELATTAGIYNAGKAATMKAGMALLKKFTADEGKKLLERRAVRFAGKAAASLVGSALQTPVAASLSIVKGTIENMAPRIGISTDDAGLLQTVTTEGDNGFKAGMKAFGENYVEVFTEHTGPALDAFTGMLGKKIGPLFAKLPPEARAAFAKLALARKWMQAKGGTVGDFAKALKKGGYHGVLNEMFEERVADLTRGAAAAIGDMAQGKGFAEAIKDAWEQYAPNEEQLRLEAASFAVPGMAAHVSNIRAEHRQLDGIHEQQRQALDRLEALRGAMPADKIGAALIHVPTPSAQELGASETSTIQEQIGAIDHRIGDLRTQLEAAGKGDGLGVDREGRNQIAEELLAAHQERHEAIQGAARSLAISEADHEISNPSPAVIAAAGAGLGTTQHAARALVKIANGVPMDGLNAAERAALESPTPDGLPRVEMVGEHPVITQGAIDRLRSVFPAAAKTIRKSETERRAEAVAANAAPKPKAAKPPTEKPAAKSMSQAGTSTPLRRLDDVENRRARILSQSLRNQGVAPELADRLAHGQVSRTGTGVPLPDQRAAILEELKKRGGATKADIPDQAERTEVNDAVHEGLKAEDAAHLGEKLDGAVEANYQEAASQLKAKGFTMGAEQEKTLRIVVRIFTPAIQRYRKAFDSIEWQEEGRNSGGAGSLSPGNITLMMEDILRQDAKGNFVNLPDLLNDPDRALKILEEEAIHGIAQKILSREEVVGLWQKLPKNLKQLVIETYFEPGDVNENDPDPEKVEFFQWNAGHEFIRMVVQGKLDGKLSETTSPGLLASVVHVLEKLLKYFQDLAANLRRSNVDEQTIAQIDSATDLIAEQIHKISSDADASDPYLSANGTNITGISRNRTRQVESGGKTNAPGRGGNSQASGNPAAGGNGQVPGAPEGISEEDDDGALQRELAKLKGEAEARQASEDRAKERRAAQVQTAANRLADFQDVLAKVPADARAIAEPLLNQAVKGEPGYVVGSNYTRLPSVLVGLPPGKVETSHGGADFKRNPVYGGENTRAYESDEAEQNKVRRIAMPGALDERTIASDTPSAAEGAPQIILAITTGADGKPAVHWQTAGGNGREMGINLAPLEDQERLSAEWQRKSERYGFQSFPEGWRGYRFLGVYDFREAGQAKAYAELVDKLNPYSGVVQDIATRAEIDAADKVPVSAIADASLDMSGAQAQDYVRALLKTPGIGLDANLMNSVVKSPVSSQLYMQRLLLSAAFHSSPLSAFFFDQVTANGAATVRALVRACTGAALQLRKKGAPEMADALGTTLATISDYVRNGDKLDRAIGKAAEQMEMGEAGKVVNLIADALQGKVEYLPVNKRGKANLDAEATVEGFEQLMADLTRTVSNFTGEADLLGEAETLPQTIERGLLAHARRFEEYKAEPGLNSRASNPAPRRIRGLQTKQRVEGLSMKETRELEELERQAGQDFMPFFDRTARFSDETVPEGMRQPALLAKAPRFDPDPERNFELAKEYFRGKYPKTGEKSAKETSDEMRTRLNGIHGEDVVTAMWQDVERLRQRYEAAKPEFDAWVQGLASEAGGRAEIADLKGVGRAVEKTLAKKRQATQLKDVLRATIVVPSVAEAQRVLSRVKAERTFSKNANGMDEVEDRFTTPTSAGYMDLIAVLDLGDGLRAELQINLPEMMEAKAIGHTPYEIQRILPNIKDADGWQLFDDLERDQRALYSAALEANQSRSAASPALARNSSSVRSEGGLERANSLTTTARPSPKLTTTAPSGPGITATGSISSEKNRVPGGNASESLGTSGFISTENIQESRGNVHVDSEALPGEPQPPALSLQQQEEPNPQAPPIQEETPEALLARRSKADPDQIGFGFGENPLTNPAPESNTPQPSPSNERQNTASTDRRHAPRPAPTSGMDDLFERLVEQRETERSERVVDWGEGDLFAAHRQLGVGNPPDRLEHGADAGRLGGGAEAVNSGVGGNSDAGGDRRGGRAPADTGGNESVPGNRRERGPGLVERPTDPAARNHAIPRGSEISPRGLVTKLRANLEAIRLLKKIEGEARPATAEERGALVKYSGWGALSQAFDDEKADRIKRGEVATRKQTAETYRGYGESAYYQGVIQQAEDEIRKLEGWQDKWGDFHRQLKESLTAEEYRRAQRSTINAHYTAPEIISAMWDMAVRLGFKGGNVLEPAAGVGHFLGLMPPELADRTKAHAVELDDLSGRITRLLYPEADVQITGFQTADLADNSIDLAISNVPFANVPVTDKAIEAMGGPVDNLHDYFFGKTLTKLRPGGLAMFITSAFTMDKGNATNRRWLAERADLVAAFRLPNDAFKANAGTDVVTDVIILRKKDGAIFDGAQDWTQLDDAQTAAGSTIRVNQYFAAHPANVLGLLADDGSMYGDAKEMTVHSDPSRPVTVALQQGVDSLPRDVAGESQRAAVRTGYAPGAVKMGNIVRRDGKYFVQGQDEPDPDLNDPKNAGRVLHFLDVRNSLNRQYELELSSEATDDEIEANRKTLNENYDFFALKYGDFHHPKNKALFIDDPDYFRLAGAEVPEKTAGGIAAMVAAIKGKQRQKFVKADVFTKRVLSPRTEPTTAKSIEDAFGISLGWRGRVDAGFIADLLGQSREQVERSLVEREIAVRDPETGQIQSREQYLSGNVRHKLEVARASGPEYQRNARLLEGVIPPDVGIEDIRFKIGATWIPASVYDQFLDSIGISNAGITYHEPVAGGRDFWEVKTSKAGFHGTAFKDYGTPRVSALELMDSLLNMQRVNIEHTDKDRKGQTDVVATQAAKDAGKKLNNAFVAWVRGNAEVAAALAPLYNREVNAFAQRTHDGQFLTFPWASNDFDIFPDKKNVVWRAIQDGFGLVAHGVGGGKTILGTAIALELRRLGMARKPMIVVHNSTLEQFADSIARIAPSSRVLVGRKDELAGAKRKEFLMRIAAGDWDAVVVAHSTFGLIEDDPDYQQRHMQAIVDEVMASLKDSGFDSIDEAKKGGRKDMSVKQRVKTVETLEGKISELSKRRTDTGLLNFQQLGVDALIVDEIHEFKKMPFSTKLDVKGIDSGMSARGYAMLMRARNIQERMGGKNVFTMTGTPVTNTLGEVWNMVRLVAPHLLREYKVETFDQFVSKFAEVETVSEETPSGERRMVERLSKVVNLPEWATFFRMAADVKFGDAMTVKGRPGIKGGKPQLVSVERTPGVAAWVSYIREVLDGFTKLGKKDFEANPGLVAVPVQAYMASRAAAIDIRLIDARAKDEPGSKTNRMIENALAIYERTTPYNGAQVIFADSYQTVKTSLFDGVVPKSGLQIELDPSKEPGSHFNLYEDIKAKLVARGVPAKEIAIITDKKYDNAKAKKLLFDDVNAGRVRIIMGSTQKLGTGVNMQERMAAAHHLDVPWTPAGLEQRDGRVYRQGNIHGEMGVDVELLRYGMKDSLDSALWQKLETKQRFITLSLSGKISGRELEEVDEILSLAEQRAILSGPYGQELFELESRIRELSASEQGHSGNVRARNFEIRAAKAGLREAEEGYGRTGAALAAMRGLAEKIAKDGVKLTVNGKAFETKTAMLEGVNAALESARQAALAIAGDAKPVTTIAANGTLLRLKPEVGIQSEFDDDGREHEVRRVTFTLEAATDESPDFGRVSSAATLLARLEEVGGTVEGIEEARKNNLRRLQQIAGMSELGEWPHQEELNKAVARQAELRALMRGTQQPAAPAPSLNARRSIPDGDTMALDFQDGITPNERVVKNLGLAYSIAEKFLPSMPGADRDDARSHARQALMRAARAWDPVKGPFGPYAAAAISNELRTTLARYQTHANRFPTTLDEATTTADGGETTAKDMVAGGEDVRREVARAETTNILDRLIAELPDHLRTVVEGVREGRTLEDIGDGLGGMTKQAVGNRAKIAFTKLRQKLGEKGIRGAQDGVLNSRASKPLHEMGPHEAMAQLQRIADAETPGQRTIGRPDLALGTLDTLVMSVDEWRKGWLKPETHADWQAQADKMLEDDYQGTKDRLMSAALSGASLSPEDVKAAMMLVQREVQKVAMNPGNIGQRNDVQLLVNAYRQARTEAARGLAAGRDPFKTPEERHREFLAKVIFTPPEKVRKQLDDAKTPDEKQKILDEDRKRISKIESELAKMGVTFADIFSGAAELRLKAAKVAKQTIDAFKDKEREALDMLMAGKSFAEVNGKTGLGIQKLKNLKQQAIAELRKRHFAKFKAGATMANVDALKAKAGVSDADAEAEFARFLDALGLVPDDRQGKRRFDASNPVDVVRVARSAQAATSNWLDMLYEAWINNILSGPATHFVNIAGNFANAAWAYTGQRGVESLLNLAMRNGDGPQVEEFKYLLAGLGKRMMEASKLAAMAWGAEYDFTAHHYLDNPVDLSTTSDKTGFVRAAIPGTTGRVVRIPGRALMWADSFFKSMIAQTEAAMQAHRMAKSEGLKGTALKARWEELMKPGSPAWEKAMETAKEHTFQQDIRKKSEGGGVFEDAVARMTEARSDNILLALLMPFVRTPFNIFRIGLRKSPLGSLAFGAHLAKGVFGKIRDGKAVAAGWGDSQTMIRDLAEQAMAWTAFAILWGAAQGDDDDDGKKMLFTGSMPMQETTRGERDLQQRAYGGSYMVRIGGRGGMEFNYGRYEPFATVIGTTVDVIRSLKRGTPAADKMDALWGYFVAQAQSKTFLQGVSDFTRAIQDGKGAGDKLSRAIVQALVPNLIRQPLRNLDEYVRDTKGGGLTYTALPAAGNAPQKLDAYGKPIEKDGNALSRLLLPTGTKPYEHLTKADEVLLRWNARNPLEKWAPQAPERTYKRNGKDVEMTAAEYSKFTALVGQKVNLKLATAIRPGATTNPTEKDVNAIRGAFEDARHEAREQMFPKRRSVREALWR